MQNSKLLSIWSKQREQRTLINAHTHKYHELVYYLSGDGQAIMGDDTYHFTGHHFAIIEAHTEHSEVHFADAEVICLEFTGASTLPTGLYADKSATIRHSLQLLLEESREQQYGYQDMLTLQLNVLLLQLLRSKNISFASKDFSYIIHFLSENFHEKISLSSCAQELNISYDYFQHKFKALTGYSPQQFLLERRLCGAEKLLTEETYTCTEIAQRCGFCTSAQFSAQFKASRGITPLKFRQLHAKKP